MTVIARLTVDQDKYLLNPSAPMMEDSVDIVLVSGGFGSLLTSGSSALRKACSTPDMAISSKLTRLCKVLQVQTVCSQVSQLIRALNVSPLVRGRDLPYCLDATRHIDMKSSAFVGDVAQDDLQI